MPRVHQGVPWQREDLGVHALIQGLRAPLLEVRAPTTPDEHRVAREGHARAAGQDESGAAIGVPGGGQSLKGQLAKGDPVAGLEQDVRFRSRGFGYDRPHLRELLPDGAARRDVIRVGVRVDHEAERHAQLRERREVPVLLLEHGVDEHRLLGFPAAEEVCEGARLGVKQLPEDDALRWRRHGGLALRGELAEQPLAHRAASGASREELDVRISGEQLRALRAVAAAVGKPRQQGRAGAHAAGALQHQRSRQPVD
mmetsp:Transcript_59262/g.163922  ORF Transcript_59262/g.163922 Transcript_59262/m.163922 type:complete len:255 (-) Transcript_59262:416-1180(-)